MHYRALSLINLMSWNSFESSWNSAWFKVIKCIPFYWSGSSYYFYQLIFQYMHLRVNMAQRLLEVCLINWVFCILSLKFVFKTTSINFVKFSDL